MTRKRSSPLGLEELLSLAVLLLVLPVITQAAPLQEYTEIQQYPEGCYYNYAHYNEGDRIMTNEPCLNCTCHNRMLMCYLRVCPFTKPIGHDCIVEKREDQCCPIITCPEVPVNVPYHTPEPGTELSIPEKFGCSIEEKFYPEGAQVPSNPNKPCELCYCINNQTKCVMQECTLHVDGCTPIYNKGSCCPVRYSCDHENDVLELEDLSTTTTTVRPTPGFILTTTMVPAVSSDCIHSGETYADGASITGKNACEHCYCMRGDIVCAVQECEIPMSTASGKICRAMPAAEGECCPSNYICEDDSATTEIVEVSTQEFSLEEGAFTTAVPVKDIHGEIPKEDVDLQEHIDDNEKDVDIATESPVDRIDDQHTTVPSEQKDKKSDKQPKVPADSRFGIPTESPTQASEEEGSGEEDAIKPTTQKVQDVSQPEEPNKESSGQEDIVKATTPSEEGSGEAEDVAPSTEAPSKETSDESEEEIVRATTPSYEGAEESKKTTTPASDTQDVATEKTPGMEGIEVEDDVKATTSVGQESDEKDVFKDTSSEPSNDADVTKTTTPAKAGSEEEEFIQATTPSKDITDEDGAIKATTESEDLTDEEEAIKATTPSKKITDKEEATTPTKEITDDEEAFKATTSSTDISHEEETVKATTPSKYLTGEEEVVKATTPSTYLTEEKEDVKPTTPTMDLTDEEEAIKATTPGKDFTNEEKADEATTPSKDLTDEDEAVKTTTPSKDLTDEEKLIKATTPSKEISDEEDVTIKPPTSTEDESAGDDSKQDTTSSEDIIDEKDITESTTPSKKLIGEDETYLSSTTTPTKKAEAEDDSKTTTPVEEELVEQATDKATSSDKTVTEEEVISQTTAPTKEINREQDKEGVKPTEETSDEEESISETTAAENTSDEAVTSKTPIPVKHDQPEDGVKSTTTKSVEEQTEFAESSTDSSTEKDTGKDKLATTSTPHILSSTTEGIREDSTESISDEEKPSAEITTAVPTHIGERTDEPTTDSEEKENDDEKADKDQTEIPEEIDSQSSTEKATSTEATDEGKPIEDKKETVSSTVIPFGKPEQPVEHAETGTEPTPAKSDIDSADAQPDQGTEKPEASEESSTDRPPAAYLPPSTKPTGPTEKVETGTDIPETSDESVTLSSTEEELAEPTKTTSEEPVDTRTELAPMQTSLAPSTEKEITSDTLPDMHLPSIIPGEGDCLVEGKTYANNTNVPATTPCDVSCKCVSSIVSCKPMECKIPEDRENCVLATDLLDGCCPTYICDMDSSTSKASDTTEEDKSTTNKAESSEKPIDRVDEEESTSTEQIPKDVIMPSGITEQPLSHVKPDEESVTTAVPILVDITPSSEVKKPATEEGPSDTDDNEIVAATEAPEIKKQTHKPADKEPSFEDDKHLEDDSTKTTTETASEKPSKAHTTKPSIEDKIQNQPEDKLEATTISPISSEEEKPSKTESGHDTVEEPETEIDDKNLGTTIALPSDEISTESSGADEKPTFDVEKIPVSTEAEITDKITTLAPSIDVSKPSDEQTDYDNESTEDSVDQTTIHSKTEKEHDKKKLFTEIPQPTTITPATETDDKTTSSQPVGEEQQSKDTSTKAPSSEEEKDTSEEVATSVPDHKKDQDKSTEIPDEKEEDSSTEKDSTPSEAEEKATTVGAVDKDSKLPEDVFEGVPTTIAPSTQDDTKKPTKEEPESPDSIENEIETESEPATTVPSTPADKKTEEPSIPVATSESDKDKLDYTTIKPSDKKIPSTTDSKLDEEKFTTVAPITDISKKPEDEKASEESSTEAEFEKATETPTLVSSTPADEKDQEDIDVAVTDSVSTNDEEPSTEKLDLSTSQPEVVATMSTPSAQDDKRKSSVTDDVVLGTTAVPTSQEDSKGEQTTPSSLEEDEDAMPATTISPSIADKEISTSVPVAEEEKDTSSEENNVTNITPSSEKPKDEIKPTDTSSSVPSTESPASEDVSTESEEHVQDKLSSTTQSSVEKVPESATETRTDADSGDADKISTVAPSSEEPSDEKEQSSSEAADIEDSDKITTIAPSAEEPASKPSDDEKQPTSSEEEEQTNIPPQSTDDKKTPSLPTTPSSLIPEHDDKKTASEVTPIEPTTQVPSSDEEDESYPTKAPVSDDKAVSTTILPAEEQSAEEDEHKPDDIDSTTESQSEKSDKASDKEPTLPSKGEEPEATTEHLFEDAAKKIPATPVGTEKQDHSTTSAAPPTESETSADDKIDTSTSPIQDDSVETTKRPVSDTTEDEDINAPTKESGDREAATDKPKIPIEIDTTTTPASTHVPGDEEIDTKPIEDFMSQTIAPGSDEDKTPESATTSAEDADKTPTTDAPVAQDIEASSEDSKKPSDKKPSDAEHVDEKPTEGDIIDHDDTTDQTATAKPVTLSTVPKLPTKVPVQEPELEKETAKPDTDKEAPVSSSEVPDSELHTVKPLDVEKSTVAPTVIPSLDSGEEGEVSGESEEDHTTAPEDAHKIDASDESTEAEQPVTDGAKKQEHDEVEIPAVVSELPQTTGTEASTEASSEDTATKHPDISSFTTVHPLFAQHFTSTAKTPAIDETALTTLPTERTTTEAVPSTTTAAPSGHDEPITPPSYGQQPQYPSYPEDDYEDEDVFGPGTCRYAGKIYVSAQQIPRDDPCDFCFCFRSDIICLQQSCPPPIAGCHEEPISGFCCPRYECPVSMAAVLNITTSTTTTSTTLPPHFLNYSHGEAVQHTGCLINGRSYKVGEPIESTSGPCISCTCGGDGKMKCNPQQCVPEPTMQQVLASYASARKR